MQHHSGALNGLQFNPHADSSHLLASGGADTTVYIHDLSHPDKPGKPFVPAPEPHAAKHSDEITRVAWNTQVRCRAPPAVA